MTVRLNPYLSFRDTAREAMEHYRSVFGGELTVSTFAELQVSQDPAEQDKVMHSMLTTPHGLVLMASDVPNAMELETGGTSISLSGDHADDAELRGYFAALADGGAVTVPFELAPWGDAFGICTDRFGIRWLVNVAGPTA